jgi:hypothetical protein
LTIATATVRAGLRTPAVWVGALLAALGFTAGLTLDVMAISGKVRALELAVGTAESLACLLGAWMAARALEQDRLSRTASTLDSTRAGVAGRLLHRWAGSLVLAWLPAVLVVLVGAYICVIQSSTSLTVYSTSILAAILESGVAAAWAVLAGRFWGAIGAALAGAAAFVVGRFVDGAAAFALPRPALVGTSAPPALDLAAQALAACGLLALACAKPDRRDVA